jgi:rare lipoprotein A
VGGCASQAPVIRDGPPSRVPPNLQQVPDAVPRVEPLRVGGPNKAYEVAGRRYVPMTEDRPLRESGLASWYGSGFHGRPTSTGEPYDMFAMTAAHKTMPLPSYARVRNPANGREIIVRVNDRGPFVEGRVIDLSYTAALKLGVLGGVAPVQVERLTFDEIRSGRWRSGVPEAGLGRDDGPASAAPGLPPPAARPAPQPDAASAAATFWVQLAAYRERDGAQAALAQWQVQLGGRVPLSLQSQDKLHRLRAGPFASRDEAEQAAQWLRQQPGLGSALVTAR